MNIKQRIILILSTAFVALNMWAQHNLYKINDNLYAIYRRAYLNRYDSTGLRSADTLMREAIRLGDKKGQMMALTIPFSYSFSNDTTIEQYDRALKPMQDFAMANGFWSYYYNGVTNRVSFMINKGYIKDVVNYINDRYEFAKKNNHPVGIYNSLMQLASYHRNLNRPSLAIKSIEDAIAFASKNLPNLDLTNVYWRLGSAYESNGDYAKELEAANRGLQQSRSPQSRMLLLRLKVKALFMLHRDDEFLQVYQELQKYPEKHGRVTDLSVVHANAMNDVLCGNYDKAISTLTDKRSFGYDKTQELLIDIYRRQGNWQKLTEVQQILLKRRIRDNEQLADVGLMDFNARYNNQILETERRNVALRNAQLKLNNSRLSLRNSNLELNHVKAKERMTSLNMDRMQLLYDKKQLEAHRLRDSIRTQREMQSLEAKEKSRQSNLLWMVLMVGVLLTTVLLIYYRNRLSLARKLNDANQQMAALNEQLERANEHLHDSSRDVMEAKNRAETANRMKTLFIQNMSHEVRTPLNAIVGFSQLMADMGNELTPDELSDMSRRIADNSSLLLTLINDIIDLTNVESGRYKVKMAEAHPNNICRMAMVIVEHRKAADVKLVMHTDATDDYTIVTDAERVAQVLINLLTNAEKNTEHGSITLDCSVADADNVRFTVTDTGIGIPEDKMEVIFERFTKLDNFKQGSGLGLNICNTIAQKLHGSLTIDRNYRQGARFIFIVPKDGDAIPGGGVKLRMKHRQDKTNTIKTDAK